MVRTDPTTELWAAFRSANTQLKRQSCWGHSNQCTVTKKCNKRMMEWCLQEAAVLLEQTVALLCHKNISLAQLHTSRLPQKKTMEVTMSHTLTPCSCNWTKFLYKTMFYSKVIPIMHYRNITLSPRESCLPTIKEHSFDVHPPNQPSVILSRLYYMENSLNISWRIKVSFQTGLKSCVFLI